jgi:hypothetical protein
MPVTHITKVFAAKDCKLWPLLPPTARALTCPV